MKEKIEQSAGKELDEEAKLEEILRKERKEISEYERSVSISFANYSTLHRAHQLTQGLSSQLMALLGGYGGITAKKFFDRSEEDLLEKTIDSKESAAASKKKGWSSFPESDKDDQEDSDEEKPKDKPDNKNKKDSDDIKSWLKS